MSHVNRTFLSGIFTNLPQPKSRVIGTVEEDDVLKTNSNLNVTKEVESNKKPSIKISIPLLSDFQNEDDDLEPTVKKQKLAVIIITMLFITYLKFMSVSERFWFI